LSIAEEGDPGPAIISDGSIRRVRSTVDILITMLSNSQSIPHTVLGVLKLEGWADELKVG